MAINHAFAFQECSQRANNGRFSLRDLLMVPMQRVLKYHLLLQVIVLYQIMSPMRRRENEERGKEE